LPLADGTLDVAVLALVLHYLPAPERALGEAARVLRPGGRLLVLDMVVHGRSEYRERMGHLWPGFARPQVEGWLGAAGLDPVAYHVLPTAAGAKGPLLFVLVGAKGGGDGWAGPGADAPG
jgi:ubiquinone/menaquinone biosynthesis C-methylase UbiE